VTGAVLTGACAVMFVFYAYEAHRTLIYPRAAVTVSILFSVVFALMAAFFWRAHI
jgi:preprotein translocase subunit Sec61beta